MVMTTAEKPRSRSKLTKALVATGVGVALLAGGGGTFAKWYDSATVDGAVITSGALGLDSVDGGQWTNIRGDEVDFATYKVVPGETFTYREQIKVHAEGDLIGARLTTNLPAITGGTDLAGALKAAVSVDGKPYAGDDMVFPGATDKTLDVQVVVTFGFNSVSGTTAQEDTAELTEFKLLLEQTQPSV